MFELLKHEAQVSDSGQFLGSGYRSAEEKSRSTMYALRSVETPALRGALAVGICEFGAALYVSLAEGGPTLESGQHFALAVANTAMAGIALYNDAPRRLQLGP